MWHKIKSFTGFTSDELKIVVTLTLLFITGLGMRVFTGTVNNTQPFTYASLDSVFLAGSNSATSSPVDSLFEKKSDEKKTAKTKKATEGELININTASQDELMKLPGVGEKTAVLIVEYREKIGRFKQPEDIMNVKGIGVKKFEKMKAFISVSDKR